MHRRLFLASFCAVAIWPWAAHAQHGTKRVIGWLSPRSAEVERPLIPLFLQGLAETGFAESTNIAVEYRFAEGDFSRLPSLAAELVAAKASLLVTVGGPLPARAARAAASGLPVVFVSGSDPVSDGLVAKINRPGGNMTGVFTLTAHFTPKRLELLREIVPGAREIAFMINRHSVQADLQVEAIEGIARASGPKILILSAGTTEELEIAFEIMATRRVDGLLMGADTFFQVRREQIVAWAARHKMPTMYEWPEFVHAGGLVSYSPSRNDSWLQAGIYAGRILNGATPGDLPVFQSSRTELVLNLKTAKVLGLHMPTAILLRADETIE